MATRQAIREWLYWDVDALFPPIFNCYAIQLAEPPLPIHVIRICSSKSGGRIDGTISKGPAMAGDEQIRAEDRRDWVSTTFGGGWLWVN